MRKYSYIFFIIFLFIFLFSCSASGEREWNYVKESPYIEDILDFAQNYEGIRLLAEIDVRIKNMLSREENPEKLIFLAEKYPEREYYFKDRISALAFYEAFKENTYEAIHEYIERFSSYGKDMTHINEAKAVLKKMDEESDWEEAFEKYNSENTILPLKNFTDTYPYSERTPGALEIITEMQDDGSYSEKYLTGTATLDLIDEFILNFPGHKDIDAALEMRKNFTGDIYDFIQAGYISASGTGYSITRCLLTIENLTDSRLIITVSYGVYFNSVNRRVQNMLIREETEITIEAGRTRSVYIETLCMNIHRDIPDNTNNFTIAVLEETSPLIKLLELLRQNNGNFAVSQAAAWHITDDPGKVRILNTIVYQDGTDAITEEDYAEAMRIIELTE
ncbi:MAG: outer membrane protein assembly factor BamD [Oscillospiraceae bacterium]|nr:outer membrane protein assembly factor BamD [Oscillospiraceae bacterium]